MENYKFKNHKLRDWILKAVILSFIIYFLVSLFLFGYFYNEKLEKIKHLKTVNEMKDKLLNNYVYDNYSIDYDQVKVKSWIKEKLNKYKLSNYKIIYDDYCYPVDPETSFTNSWMSEYGYRVIEGWYHFHQGYDFSITNNYDAVSVCDANVILTGWDDYWGRFIFIRDVNHHDRIFHYAHLEEILVKENQRVNKNDSIGIVGGTGNNGRGFPIHLHFAPYILKSDGNYYSYNFFQGSLHCREKEKIKKEDRLLYKYFKENLL